jgi:hypothetical protein
VRVAVNPGLFESAPHGRPPREMPEPVIIPPTWNGIGQPSCILQHYSPRATGSVLAGIITQQEAYHPGLGPTPRHPSRVWLPANADSHQTVTTLSLEGSHSASRGRS